MLYIMSYIDICNRVANEVSQSPIAIAVTS